MGNVGWQGATKENIPGGSSTEEATQPAGLYRENPEGASGLLPSAVVGSAFTARSEDAQASPPWHTPKSLSAGSLPVLNQALASITFPALSPPASGRGTERSGAAGPAGNAAKVAGSRAME